MRLHSSPDRRHRPGPALISVFAVLSLVAGLVAAVHLLTPAPAPAASAGSPVSVSPVKSHAAAVAAARSWHRPAAAWPAARTGTAVIGAGAGAAVRAGTLPVWVGPSATGTVASPARRKTRSTTAQYPGYGSGGHLAARPKGAPVPAAAAKPAAVMPPSTSSPPGPGLVASLSAPVSQAQVQVLPHAAATALGVTGAVFTVARADGVQAAGRVHVSFDYAGFRYAYGGTYASRLRIVELPACALTTPQLPACRVQVPLASADDVTASRAAADVTVPAASAAPGTAQSAAVLAVTASAQGSAGDYAAEPASEMNQWLSGDSSGAYQYSYDITVPPVPGGLAPDGSLRYDSQLADGITAAANPQASEVGDGWESAVPGYIEIDYQTCAANFAEPDILDLCDQVQSESVTTSGATTPIVLDGSTGAFKEEGDDGSQVQRLSGGGWLITGADGTKYYYGLNKLPGWASGNAQTNSVWTVPLWAGNSEETTAAPWRYMLDYVVSATGNAIAYFYSTQGNYYATDGGSRANGQYTAGGVLAKTEYGLRDNGNVYAQAPAAEIDYSYAATRQDAPADLACASGAACTVNAPTFWTSSALSQITTKSEINGALVPVDSYQLIQSYPATGDASTSPSLWLTSIQRTGQDGTAPVTLPATRFTPTPMANLDQTSADKSSGYSLITRARLTSVTSDHGAVTTIAYTGKDANCTSGKFPSLWANADRCYPDYWYTDPLADTQTLDWYNLYAASTVTLADPTGGGPSIVTAYSYGTPGWHYDNDEVSRSVYPTWDQWRGFQAVTTQTGTSPDPVTKTVSSYYQGLSNDHGAYTVTNGEEGNGTVTLTTSHGVSVTDDDQNAGEVLQTRVFNGTGGSEVTDTEYNVPAFSQQTAAQTVDSSLFLYRDAFLTDNGGADGGTATDTWTDLASGTAQETVLSNSFDSSGNVTGTDYKPWGAAETCTSVSYVMSTSSHVTKQKEVKVTAGSCSSPGTVVSDTEYAYDGGAFGGIPTQGLVTGTEQIGATASGGTVTTAKTYDQYGRVLTSADADNRTTTTAYTPAGAEPTSVTVTDPKGLATTTGYDPARDLALTVTDPAGYVTTKAYDALGRVTAEWTPGNAASGNPVTKYAYTDSATAPSATTTQTEEPGGGYLTSVTLYDSLDRQAEVQDGTASGGSDITQTTYDSGGNKSFVSGPYYTSAAPSATLVTAPASSVADETGYAYDGDGRTVKLVSDKNGTETWEADTTYGGNYTTVVPPSGGTNQTTFINGLNQTTAIYQYHAGATPSPSDAPSSYDQTSYTYTPAGKLASITDASANTWRYTYDGLGNRTSQADPDAGAGVSTYDNAGQLMSVTDARGKAISYTYDQDGRKTAGYDTTGGAAESSSDEIASWIWDTLANGKLTSSTSHVGGAAYTVQLSGYNAFGLATGSQTIIPAAQGQLAGTYTTSYTYAPDGAVLSYTDSAAGGLAAETVTTGYDSAGSPVALTGASSYVSTLSYTGLQQPLQYALGAASAPVYITDSYDPQTGNLAEQATQTGTAATGVDDQHYSYDPAGLVTAEADTPSGDAAATDVQCFGYDYLGRLTQAWAHGSAGCAASPTSANEGGIAPYLEGYSYNPENDLTGITATSPAGTVTTTALSYPSAGTAHPHAATTSTTTVGTGAPSATGYGYDADGNLTSVSSGSGNQALTWSDGGQLTQIAVTPPGGATAGTTFIYDADGNQLLRTDPGTVTVYLSDEELVLDTSTGTVTGTRYYSIAGQEVAARTSTTGGTSLAWVAGDSQRTVTVAIDSSTLAVTRRWYDPYGNPRGAAPSAFPGGQKGFVGGTADTATGLTDLGAREYQPTTGSFISPDPLLDPNDPQSLNPYAYAKDGPSAFSDPTGLYWVIVARGSFSTAWLSAARFGNAIANWVVRNVKVGLVFPWLGNVLWSKVYVYNPQAKVVGTYAVWEWFTSDHKPTSTFLLKANGKIYAKARWVFEVEAGFWPFTSFKLYEKQGWTPAIPVATCTIVAGISADMKSVIARAVLACL
jgi:RHS repeat-associated protein